MTFAMSVLLLFISLASVAAASAAFQKSLMRHEKNGGIVAPDALASTASTAATATTASGAPAKPYVKLPADKCDTSFFTQGSGCVDGDAAKCNKWEVDVPKVERAPYVAILQIRAIGNKNFAQVATALGEANMATGEWKPSAEDAAARAAHQNAVTLLQETSNPAASMISGTSCINPSTSGPSEWAAKCCTCVQRLLDNCQGEVSAECFKKQLCKSKAVCKAWQRTSCPKFSSLFERGAHVGKKDAVTSLDDAVQGKGGDTCD